MSEAIGRLDRYRLEEMLLGGVRRYTRGEVAELAGVSLEFTARVWQAMGFASLPDDEPAFTDADVAAMRRLAGMIAHDLLDADVAVRLARAMGQTMARMAEWQTDIVINSLLDSRRSPSDAEVTRIIELVERLVPEIEPLVVHTWRRQIAASGTHALAHADEHADAHADALPAMRPLVVGFVDLVSFTEVSRQMDEAELAELVEGFETLAANLIAGGGARLVKTLGDEVLFTAERAADAVEVALRLAEAMDTHRVRVGLVYGPVLSLMGDVFGTTVNLASRITAMAQPGTVLGDGGLVEAIGGTAAYRTIEIQRRAARGLGMIQPYVIRRV